MSKKIVNEIIAYDIVDRLNLLEIDEVCKFFNSLKDKKFDRTYIKVEYNYDYTALSVIGSRNETDEEYEKRCKIEEQRKKKEN